jgi:hypothetical protein
LLLGPRGSIPRSRSTSDSAMTAGGCKRRRQLLLASDYSQLRSEWLLAKEMRNTSEM